MTKEDFTVQILDMKKTLYHIACGILRSEADREDAVQECILKAWEKRDSLKNDAAFRAWVTRILVNECYDICRRSGKVIVLDELPESTAPEDTEGRELRELIMEMDEIYRMPIIMFYIEGFSIREISRILRIPEGTVKSRLFAGRAKLRSVLGEEEEVPV
jgi:RNA polymerase sigma factor, sigma-70 family